MRKPASLQPIPAFAMMLALMAFLVQPAALWSQALHTYVYTDLDGLPSAKVFDIDQDGDGVMWFATLGGLASFDGVTWEESDPPPHLPRDFCHHIELDHAGRLWVAPEELNDGIAVLENGTWTPISQPPDLTLLTFIAEMCLIETAAGTRIALATIGEGVFVWDGATWQHYGEEEGLRGGAAFALATYDEKLLIGTDEGLSALEGGTISSFGERYGIPDGTVIGIAVERPTGSAPRIWILGPRWLGYLEEDRFRTLVEGDALPPVNVEFTQLEPDRVGGLYFGNNSGFWHYSGQSKSVRAIGVTEGLGDEGASSLYFDVDGNLWVGNYRGANRIPMPRFLSYRRDQGLMDDEVSAVTEFPEGRIVFGQRDGLCFLRNGQITSLPIPEMSESTAVNYAKILDLCPDGKGNLWAAASRGGVARIGSDDKAHWLVDPRLPEGGLMSGVLVDREGELWLATDAGLFTLSDGKITKVPLDGLANARRVFQGRKSHALYVASAGGGLFVRGADRQWNRFQHPVQAKNNVFAAYEYDDGANGVRVLVGPAGGLCKIEDDRIVREQEIEINDQVFFIVADAAGRLWFGTDKGVVRWDGTRARRFGFHECLAGQETNRAAGFLDSTGVLWIGTDNGVSSYQEHCDNFAAVAPSVRRLEASVNGKPVAITGLGQVVLERDDVTFRFRAVSFLGEGIVQYHYRLDGFDEDWLPETTNREIRYTSLPAGRYRFRVQARNSLGTWGPEAILSLNDVVRETLGLVRSVVGKGIEVVSSFEDDAGYVIADRGQLEQILMNLSINARDAMPDGGEIRIVTHRRDKLPPRATVSEGETPNGGYAVLEVRDSGTGIAPEILSRVFEPFFTTKDVDHGTGLGLPAVYGIVRQTGGQIFVDSEPDHGSTFWIYFPRGDVPEGATVPSSDSGSE